MSALIFLAAAAISQCHKARSGLEDRECVAELSIAVEKELNNQWKATVSAVRQQDRDNQRLNVPKSLPGLIASQRAWLAYRFAECAMVSEQFAGGSGVGEADALCQVDLTRQRILDLKLRTKHTLIPKRDLY